jgi:hypothetical protein
MVADVVNLPLPKPRKVRKRRARELLPADRVAMLFQALIFDADNDNRCACRGCGNCTETISGTGLRGRYDRCAFCRAPKSKPRPR